MPAPHHTLRPATTASADHLRLLSFTDSQLPHLPPAQWGTEPQLPSPAQRAKYAALVARAERSLAWGAPGWARAYVLEAASGRAVAMMVLEARGAEYAQGVLGGEGFVYVRMVVRDRGAGEEGRGSGRVLVGVAEGVAREVGVRRVCLDAWRGGGGGLVG